MPSHFIVSLDFELHWGIRDHTPVEAYREELLGVWKAIPRLLQVFEARGIRATWAVVGMLMARSREELLESLPSVRPRYRDPRLDPYRALSELGKDEDDDPFHFAPSLVAAIAAVPGQEVATHTFSHFYALEEGASVDALAADLAAARAMMLRRDLPPPRSIVFPRNQYAAEHLRILPGCGISAFRGHARAVFERPASGRRDHLVRRAARLADAYVPLSPARARPRRVPDVQLVELPASRFLRPWSARRAPLDALRLARIHRGMTSAARAGSDFHLWWHPHNFGAHLTENMGFLSRILDHYHDLSVRYGMRSVHMADRAAALGL